MGTGRPGGGRAELWRVLASDREQLTEFDWGSLRRDPRAAAAERAARAEVSLGKLNAVLRARERRRRLVPLATAALAGLALPLLTAFTVQRLRHA
jgi:hypothetical protein